MLFAVAEKNTIYKYIYFSPASVVTGVGKDGLKHCPPCPFPLPVARRISEVTKILYVKDLER